jgi:hypothetical protein
MKTDYTVLVNFARPWKVRCRSDLDTGRFIKQNECYRIRGVWYLPIYTGNKSVATRVANSLKTVSKSL